MQKNNVVIFLNGEYSEDNQRIIKMCQNKKIICVDGGANIAYKLGIKPSLIVGDMDSIEPNVLKYYKTQKVEIVEVNPKKDYTDFEIALLILQNKSIANLNKRFLESEYIDIKYTKKFSTYDIMVFGATGKRIDMTLSNMKKLHNSLNMVFITEKFETIKYLKFDKSYVKHQLFNIENKEFSIVPITDLKELTLIGFEYPLKNITISRNLSLVSNVVNDAISVIECKQGEMYIIVGD